MVPLDILPAPLDGPLVHIDAPVFADVADFAQDPDGQAPDTTSYVQDAGARRETQARDQPSRFVSSGLQEAVVVGEGRPAQAQFAWRKDCAAAEDAIPSEEASDSGRVTALPARRFSPNW